MIKKYIEKLRCKAELRKIKKMSRKLSAEQLRRVLEHLENTVK